MREGKKGSRSDMTRGMRERIIYNLIMYDNIKKSF